MLVNSRRHQAFISRQEELPAQHPATRMEDVPGGLGGACGKGNRRRVDQHSQKDVAFRCLKEQLDVIPRQNQN